MHWKAMQMDTKVLVFLVLLESLAGVVWAIDPEAWTLPWWNARQDALQKVVELKAMGFTAEELQEAGFSRRVLLRAGYQRSDIIDSRGIHGDSGGRDGGGANDGDKDDDSDVHDGGVDDDAAAAFDGGGGGGGDGDDPDDDDDSEAMSRDDGSGVRLHIRHPKNGLINRYVPALGDLIPDVHLSFGQGWLADRVRGNASDFSKPKWANVKS